MTTFRVIGPGRAGTAVAHGLERAGWEARPAVRRGDPLDEAAAGVDVLVVAVPDRLIPEVAAQVEPVPTTTLVHLSGALGPDALAPHHRRAAVHLLVSLTGSPRDETVLGEGAWFAVDADPGGREAAEQMVSALGGHAFHVPAERRGLYHATAAVGSNHLVALLAQVERLSDLCGVPFEAFLSLARRTLGNVEALGPAQALTGPASRGDWGTIDLHRAALPEAERELYEALSAAAARLAGRDLPPPSV